MSRALRPNWTEPLPERVDPDEPGGALIGEAHRLAMAEGRAGYIDPESELFVMTAGELAQRGYCCENGCRHCPYEQSVTEDG